MLANHSLGILELMVATAENQFATYGHAAEDDVPSTMFGEELWG